MQTPSSTSEISYTSAPDEGRSYSIRRHHDSYRYRITIPRKTLESGGVEHQDRLGIHLRQSEGHAVIVYTTNLSASSLSFKVNKHTSGEIGIPSAIGAALQLSGNEIRWSDSKQKDGSHVFAGHTDVELAEINLSDGESLKTQSLTHVTQNINDETEGWDQEYFSAYFDSKDAVSWLGEGSEPRVAVGIQRVDDVPCVTLSPSLENANKKSTKNVVWSNKSHHDHTSTDSNSNSELSRDAVVYLPNDIVRALNLVEQDLSWFQYGDDMVFVPTN